MSASSPNSFSYLPLVIFLSLPLKTCSQKRLKQTHSVPYRSNLEDSKQVPRSNSIVARVLSFLRPRPRGKGESCSFWNCPISLWLSHWGNGLLKEGTIPSGLRGWGRTRHMEKTEQVERPQQAWKVHSSDQRRSRTWRNHSKMLSTPVRTTHPSRCSSDVATIHSGYLWVQNFHDVLRRFLFHCFLGFGLLFAS